MPKKYQPTNGTEGMGFESKWCDNCVRDAAFRANMKSGDGCQILTYAMVYDTEDDQYPAEWTYDKDGAPCCTAFSTGETENHPREMKMREDRGQLNLFKQKETKND